MKEEPIQEFFSTVGFELPLGLVCCKTLLGHCPTAYCVQWQSLAVGYPIKKSKHFRSSPVEVD